MDKWYYYVGNSQIHFGGKQMELFYAIYGFIRYLILSNEPNAADEFAVLDAIFGYEVEA